MIPPRGRSLPPAGGDLPGNAPLQPADITTPPDFVPSLHCRTRSSAPLFITDAASLRPLLVDIPRRPAARLLCSQVAQRRRRRSAGGQLQRALQGAGKFKPGRVPAALVYHWAEGGGRGRGPGASGSPPAPPDPGAAAAPRRDSPRGGVVGAVPGSARWRSVRVEAPPSDPEPVSGTADRQTGHRQPSAGPTRADRPRPRHPSAAIKPWRPGDLTSQSFDKQRPSAG